MQAFSLPRQDRTGWSLVSEGCQMNQLQCHVLMPHSSFFLRLQSQQEQLCSDSSVDVAMHQQCVHWDPRTSDPPFNHAYRPQGSTVPRHMHTFQMGSSANCTNIGFSFEVPPAPRAFTTRLSLEEKCHSPHSARCSASGLHESV